jgi:hypothetical protein
MSIYKKLLVIQKELKGLKKDKKSNNYDYVTGNIESPNELVVCDYEHGDRSFCKSAYFYKGFYITSSFKKKRIENYVNIKTAFKELLDKWEVK